MASIPSSTRRSPGFQAMRLMALSPTSTQDRIELHKREGFLLLSLSKK
jgi:hypothetical protein